MRWINLSYKVGALIVGVVAWWVIENRQADFAKDFEKSLRAIHPELETERLDLSGDRAYAIFALSLTTYSDRSSGDKLKSLATDIEKVYCAQVAKAKGDLNVPLFHISVRTYVGNQGTIAFTHSFAANGCA